MTAPPAARPLRGSPWVRAGSWVRRLPARTPLRVKLVAALLSLVTVALAAAGFAATTALRGYLVQRVDGQLQDVVRSFASGRPGGGFDRDGDHGPRLPSDFYVEYADTSGTPVLVSSNPLATSAPTPALPRLTLTQTVSRNGHPFTVPARTGGGNWRVVAAPLVDRSGSVLVAQSLSDVQHTVGRLASLERIIGASVVVLLAGVGYVVVRRSLRPLTEVEHTAAAIAAGDLSRRVPESDPRTEVGRLSAALNGMLGQIERAFHVQHASEVAARKSEQQMRQFVADASHELRTPLTSIRGFAELHRQGAAAQPEDIRRLMRRIEDEAARMGVLVDDLLLLARLDSQRPLERKPVDLLTLAADAVHDARAVDPGRQITLDVSSGAVPPVVTGDEPRLRQVVGNLMSNALSHTPPGTPVRVRLTTRPDSRNGPAWAVLEIADRGPGLGPQEAERVFERFYRADASRTRSQGGSGLGLSIVAELTAAHGGRVELDTGQGRGATFRVLLPLEVGSAADDPTLPSAQPPLRQDPVADSAAPALHATNAAAPSPS